MHEFVFGGTGADTLIARILRAHIEGIAHGAIAFKAAHTAIQPAFAISGQAVF